MNVAEKGEVKALIEKIVADAAKVAAQLEAKVAQLQAEVERKNKTLEGFIAENEALKRELGKAAAPLQVASASFGGGFVAAETGPALCAGCYHLRLWFAVLAGIAASGFLTLKLYARPDVLQNIARAATGRDDAAYPVLAALAILSGAAPALAVAAHWKWKQFKNGAPGGLRGMAEAWGAVKDAFKRGKSQ